MVEPIWAARLLRPPADGGVGQFLVAIDALPEKLVQARPLGTDETRIHARRRRHGHQFCAITHDPADDHRGDQSIRLNRVGRHDGRAGGARLRRADLQRCQDHRRERRHAPAAQGSAAVDAQHELKVDIERIRLSEINGIFARLARDDVAKRSVIDFEAAA